MAINSMTGYGRSDFILNDVTYGIEIRSLNHRYREIRLKIPDSLFSLEDRIRKEIEKRFTRGTISLHISCHEDENGIMGLEINESIAKEYLALLQKLQRNLGIEGELNLGLLLGLKGVIIHKKSIIGDKNWTVIGNSLNKALTELTEMRRIEGSALIKDIEVRLNGLLQYISDIEKRGPAAQREHMERLKHRLNELTKNYEIDDVRLLQEIALLAEKSDVTEEITRLKTHISQFKETLKGVSPVGRKMDFICQEMLREVNTMGSKNIDTLISTLVVELKSEIDRIKEQVQNIE